MTELQKAPALPKGYFFRVRKGSYRYVVELHRKIVGRLITKQFDYWYTDEADQIFYLMAKLKEQLEYRIEQKKNGEKYYGDYPPKTTIGGKD